MKTLHQIASVLLAAGSAAVAFLVLSAFISADLALASLVTVGVAAFALFDYSRSSRSLATPAQILRPSLPSSAASSVTCSVRRAA
ncbi:MAG TPA: hypothetical protein VIM71_10505 [Lacunisphaera sp.]